MKVLGIYGSPRQGGNSDILLDVAQAVILSTPIFFYNVPAQAKALIDRTQACWAARFLKKGRDRSRYEGGKGYLIAVGATKGQNLFQGVELTAKYFFDAMDMSYHGGVLHRGIEGKGSVNEYPEVLEQARQLGRDVAKGQL